MTTLSANGIDLYYEDHGSGPAVLLIPPTGWPGNVWHLEQVPVLSRRFRVITYDQRGTGLSAKPDVDYTTSLLAQDALELLRSLDALPAHVFGFSTGGQIAQVMALSDPGAIRSLILAGSNPGASMRAGIPLTLALRLIEDGYGADYWLHHLTDSDFPFSSAFRATQPQKVRALADAIRLRQAPLKMYLRHVLAREGHDTRSRLRDIRVPTLVLVGAEDRDRHSARGDHWQTARRLAQEIPSAKFADIPNAHHLFPWEAAEETNRIVAEFFDSASTQPRIPSVAHGIAE